MPNISPPANYKEYGEKRSTTVVDGVITQDSISPNQLYRLVTISRRGTVTPNFAVNAASGMLKLPVNYFVMAKTIDQRETGVVKHQTTAIGTKKKTVSTVKGVMLYGASSNIGFSEVEKTNAYIGALTAARLKVKRESVNLAVAVAESKQTWDLLAESFSRISKSYSFVRKGKFLQAAREIPSINVKSLQRLWRKDEGKAVSQAILELQYGWRPLISDIYGSLEAIDRIHKDEVPYFRVASGKKLVQTRTVTTVNTAAHQIITDQHECSYERKIVLYYSLNSTTRTRLASLGLTNPAVVVWEKIPFSFVVDWLLKVGSYLSQFDASLGWTFMKGSDTYFEVNDVVTTRKWNTPFGYYDWYIMDLMSRRTQINNGRTGIFQEPVALLPYIKNPLSNEHTINAMALLATNIRK